MNTHPDSASTQFHTLAELHMAQIHLVPTMAEQGLHITAGGHGFTLLPGPLASRLSDELNRALRLEIMRREAEYKTTNGAGA